MQFYSTLLLSLLSATAHAGSIVGGFEVIGTICYPPDQKGEDKVVITTVSPASANQRIVMYDDQPESYDQAVKVAGDCKAQLSYAKMLTTSSGGTSMVPGWSIASGGTFSETITINQGNKRQWWVAVVNCDEASGVASPVSLSSFSIVDSGKVSVDCSTMGQYSVAGYNWAIVLMVFAVITAAIFAFLFWNKSRIGPSGVVNTDGVGYNEL
tara:strand:+ start:237 stop:869 length:633 start_codon:yes stop_codon:yes gene_type:complete